MVRGEQLSDQENAAYEEVSLCLGGCLLCVVC